MKIHVLLFAALFCSSDAVNKQEIYKLYYQPIHSQNSKSNAKPAPGMSPSIGSSPKGDPYPILLDEKMQEAKDTFRYLLEQPRFDDFISTCSRIRDVANEELYAFALSMALRHRNDTCDIQTPPIEEVMPHWYLPASVIKKAQQQVKNASDPNATIVIEYENEIIGNGSDPENRLAYFREDLGINAHRWNWHLFYPNNMIPGPNELRDRQGELFYWMHQQIIARYNNDRYCNGLPLVVPHDDFRAPIPEEYAPRLLSAVSGTEYPARPKNLRMRDVPDRNITVDLLELWRDTIMQSIAQGTVIKNDSTVIALVEPEGIDLLGAIVEASARSINQALYGNLHNRGHITLGRITTADQVGGLNGIMSFIAAAMRDPLFYRWHCFIDNIFVSYKNKAKVYTQNDLSHNGVIITKAFIRAGNKENVVHTFWDRRKVFISRGVDFSGTTPVIVTVRHIQHEQFTHHIMIDNKSGKETSVTVRIYIAPIKDEKKNVIPFSKQRTLYLHLDTFVTKLKTGLQMITRRSQDSTVTVPTPRSFDELERPINTTLDNATRASCGCGWPDSMALPRGTAEGKEFHYFVMVTDGADYNERSGCCTTAPSYCGILNQPYPDRRSMGFPFDRPAPSYIKSVTDFPTRFTNTMVSQFRVVYKNENRKAHG